MNTTQTEKQPLESRGLEKATFGGGCFWCTEAVFLRLKGVQAVVSGYSGGHVASPSYQAVCTGATGHAEVVQIAFDPKTISYPELLEVFWKTHDPTTLNRQGPDFGTQYRSVIFFHSDEQRKLAQHYKDKLNEARASAPQSSRKSARSPSSIPRKTIIKISTSGTRDRRTAEPSCGPRSRSSRKHFAIG